MAGALEDQGRDPGQGFDLFDRVPLQKPRARVESVPERAELPARKARVVERADPDAQIESFVNQIDEPPAQLEFHLHMWMQLQVLAQEGHDKLRPEFHPGRDPKESGRRVLGAGDRGHRLLARTEDAECPVVEVPPDFGGPKTPGGADQ